MREQIQAIVWSVFGWDDGHGRLHPRPRQAPRVREARDPDSAGGAAAASASCPTHACSSRASASKTTSCSGPHAAIDDLHLSADEQRLLDAVDGRRALYDLVNTPPLPPGENARILYAFFALGLIVAARPARQIKVQVKMAET